MCSRLQTSRLQDFKTSRLQDLPNSRLKMALPRRRERLRVGDDDIYRLTVSTCAMSLVKASSVGKRLVTMITDRLMQFGGQINTADPDLPVASTRDTWMRFAGAWKARAEETGVATIVLGHDANDRLRSIVVGDIHGGLMAVPVTVFDSGDDVYLPPPGTPEWIAACLPELTEILKNRQVVKVVSPADVAHALVSEGGTFPVMDPVIIAEIMAPEKFHYWVNRKVNKRQVETTAFGIKMAVHYFCGRQDGPYLPDEFPEKEERQQKHMAEWPGDYSIAQKRWILEKSLTCILSVLAMAEMFMMPSAKNINEERLGEALAIVMRDMGFDCQTHVEYWGCSQRFDCSRSGPGRTGTGTIRRLDDSSTISSSNSSGSWRVNATRVCPCRTGTNTDEHDDDDDDESWTTAVGALIDSDDEVDHDNNLMTIDE